MKKLYFALITAFLLSIFWPGVWGVETQPFTLVWLFALVPLLWVEHELRLKPGRRKGWRVFGYAYVSMGAFNLGTTYWVWNAHWSGVVATVLINGGLMALVWTLYSWVARRHSQRIGYWALVSGWLALEVFHEDWAFSFPWLDLGHIFAATPSAVQWYEFTGHRGGTLWLIASNIVCFEAILQLKTTRLTWKDWRFIFRTAVPYVWGAPLLLSAGIAWMQADLYTQTVQVSYVQPSVDPYLEKFKTSDVEQAERWVGEVVSAFNNTESEEKQVGPSALVVFPETFLHQGIQESSGNAFRSIHALDSILRKFPQTSLLVGASTFEIYAAGDESETARPFGSKGDRYYDSFNTAIELTSNQPMEFYHKSKLVVGVEYMPFASLLKSLLGDVTIEMGGTTGTLGTQKEREVFALADTAIRVAPIICWEQDYGSYVREYALEGANVFAIMTNDGWWGNTLGHRTHFHIARLRAIENRRAIVRAANTGVSGFIGPDGQSYEFMTWNEEGLRTSQVALNNSMTFYTQYGDLIGRGGALLFPLLLLSVLVRQRVQR